MGPYQTNRVEQKQYIQTSIYKHTFFLKKHISFHCLHEKYLGSLNVMLFSTIMILFFESLN